MEKNRYGDINELIKEVEALGDWKDVSQKEGYLKILSKIAAIYEGYEIKNENGETTRGYYPKEVTEAIVEVCKSKFPRDRSEAYDENYNLKEGYPEYSYYLFLVSEASNISYMVERTDIDQIARQEFGINIYDKTTTREEVNGLINSSKKYLEQKNRYGDINELISEVEALGDWKDPSQKEGYLKILSKIAAIYEGYEIKNENGETTRGYYPKEVTEAIVEVCKSKFPRDRSEAYDENYNLKEGYPEYSYYLFLVSEASNISYMVERTDIDQIARQEFGINIYDKTATREEVNGLINSSREYLNKNKEQESNPERQEKKERIIKSQAEKEAIRQEINQIDKEIEELTALLEQKKTQKNDLLNSLEEK